MSIFSNASYAQTSTASITSILSQLQQIIETAEKRDMEVVRVEADIIRTTKETYRVLDPSYRYSIIAVGSSRIKDLDIEVYKKIDGEWTLIQKDDDNQNVAGVEIKPSAYADYKILIKAYAFYEGYDVGHYGLAVIHN